MPRSSHYILLLKKLVAATQHSDRKEFEREIEEIRVLMDELSEEERFDLEINIKTETKKYYDHLE